MSTDGMVQIESLMHEKVTRKFKDDSVSRVTVKEDPA